MDIVVIGHYRDDREMIIAIVEDEGAGHHLRWQEAVLKQAETITGGLCYLKRPVGRHFSMSQRGGGAVGGIAQGGAFWYLHLEIQGAREDLSILIYHGGIQLVCGETSVLGVRLSGRRIARNAPLLASIHLAGIRGARYGLRISLLGDDLLAVRHYDDSTLILQVCIYLAEGRLGVDVMMVEIEHRVAMGWQNAIGGDEAVLLEVCGVVGDIQSTQIHVLIAGVIEFHPTAIIE